MSRRKSPDDGLADAQLAILREQTTAWLLAKAADLQHLSREEDPDRTVEEVVALAGLASGLDSGAIDLRDGIARELVARRTTETIYLDELKERYDRELGEHEAWSALLAHFATGAEDDRRAGRE